jgi:hypothetical protein
MKKFNFYWVWVIFFLFIISNVAEAQTLINSLQPGAAVKIVKKDGNAFEGKIIKATPTEYAINTPQGLSVKKYLKEIKKITDTGKTDTAGGISYRPVHEYVTISDQSFQGVYFGGSGMVFDLDLGVFGLQKGIAIESLKSIEVIDAGAVTASEQEVTVTCPHCGKPIKIRISK